MVKCSEGCIPTCQHCIYAEYEKLEIDGKTYNGEAEQCSKHHQEINASYWCKDFHCFRAQNLPLSGDRHGKQMRVLRSDHPGRKASMSKLRERTETEA